MRKRAVSILLSFAILISLSVMSAKADNTYNVYELRQCSQLYSYSGTNSAYFFGCKDKTLYSSRVIPDCINRYVSVSGYIRAVCHDENNAYALYDGGKNQLGVIRMNMNSGSCDRCTINDTSKASNRSFAVCGNEIFIIFNGTFPYVKSFDFSGRALYTYSFEQGAECLFTNGGFAYAKAYSGGIFKLSGGNRTKCAELEAHTGFTDAGAGYLMASDKRIIPLSGGYTERLSCDFAAKTANNTFTLSGNKLSFNSGEAEVTSAKLLCAAGSKAAVLTDNFNCEVINCSGHTTNKNGSANPVGMKIVDNYIVGIEPEITVSNLKDKYPQITKVLDNSRNEITSGKVRTGFYAVTGGREYELALRGDINASGTVNTADISDLMNALSGASALSPVNQKAADFDLDGSADTRDLVMIAKKIK